ncbi:MAG: phospholipase [Paludibacteraceae bacterium]|nr:phospholipase [Paludibacteraceae bacterium]
MIEVIAFIGLGIVILVLFEWRERRRKGKTSPHPSPQEREIKNDSGECCGTHLVCERDTIQQMQTEIVYYDDEELDALADRDPKIYTEQEITQLEEVFRSLREEDIRGWVKSLQLRRIALTDELKEEALLILVESRKTAALKDKR